MNLKFKIMSFVLKKNWIVINDFFNAIPLRGGVVFFIDSLSPYLTNPKAVPGFSTSGTVLNIYPHSPVLCKRCEPKPRSRHLLQAVSAHYVRLTCLGQPVFGRLLKFIMRP